MAHLQPAYRLTVYAPRSVDATEATVLTPAAAAPHAEPFQIATLRGLTGYRPYLLPPSGRRGGFDPLTKRVDSGEMTFQVFDKRTEDGTNAQRWLTAFAGDGDGRPALLNNRVIVEESLDGGATWAAFFVGRVQSLSLDAPLIGTLTVRDESERLDQQIFVGRPHASCTYAKAQAVLPVQVPGGPGSSYRAMQGTVVHDTAAEFFRIDLDMKSATKESGNVVSRGLDSLCIRTGRGGYSSAHGVVNGYDQRFAENINPAGVARAGPSKVRARVAWSGGSGEYAVISVLSTQKNGNTSYYYQPFTMKLGQYAPGTLGYATRPANGATVTVTLIADAPASKDAPHMIGPVDPLTLWQDILAGKFSRLAEDGSVRETFPANTAAFTALAASRSFIPLTAVPTKPEEARAFIESHILRPYHLGYRLSASGEVVPFDCRRSASLASATALTNDDAAPLRAGAFGWTQDRSDALSSIRVEAFRDEAPQITELIENGSRPILSAPAGAMKSDPLTVIVADFTPRAIDVTGKEHVVDAPGWRARQDLLGKNVFQTILTILTDGFSAASKPEEAIFAASSALAAQLRGLFGAGSTTMHRAFRRVSAGDVYPGMWRRLSVDEAPNAATYERGGERLGLCIDRIEEGPFVGLTFLDGGYSSVAVVPSLATLTIDGVTGVPTVTVTRNAAGDRIVLEVALTNQSTVVSPTTGWIDGGVATADGVFTLPTAPAGMRLWVRAHSAPEATDDDFQLPSAVVAPSPAYIDTGVLTPPSSVAVTNIGKTVADLSWTVGEPSMLTEIMLSTGSYSSELFDDPGLQIAVLPAGSTSYRLRGLDGPSVAHSVGVRHVLPASGRFTAIATADFTTGTTDPQLPRPAGLAIAAPLT